MNQSGDKKNRLNSKGFKRINQINIKYGIIKHAEILTYAEYLKWRRTFWTLVKTSNIIKKEDSKLLYKIDKKLELFTETPYNSLIKI